MKKKIFVKFQTTGKIYQYDALARRRGEKEQLKMGDLVLVETPQGIEVGKVVTLPCQGKCKARETCQVGAAAPAESGEGKILRKITENDRQKLALLKEKAKKYLPEVAEKIAKYSLQMKLIDADLSLDEKKLTFYFGAEGRVDFRALVSDLVKSFKKIIRLQQVGARDEAKIFQGFGKCGRQLCCAKFLQNIQSVTIEMAQVQQLEHLGTAKLSGACGKLMCCLAYELEEYQKALKNLPPIGNSFKTKLGEGKITGYNVLKQTVFVQLNNKDASTIEVNLKGEKIR